MNILWRQSNIDKYLLVTQNNNHASNDKEETESLASS